MYSDIVFKISAMIFDLFSKDNMHLCKYLLVQNQPFRLYFIANSYVWRNYKFANEYVSNAVQYFALSIVVVQYSMLLNIKM